MAHAHPSLLVVDDDDEVRDLAVTVLELEGYRVQSAPDAATALELIRADRSIRLLFTDIVMPGMDGFMLAQEARRLRPDLRIVYTSGFLKRAPSSLKDVLLIDKPWNVDRLRETIQKIWHAGDC